jgi:hypothetical protein
MPWLIENHLSVYSKDLSQKALKLISFLYEIKMPLAK